MIGRVMVAGDPVAAGDRPIRGGTHRDADSPQHHQRSAPPVARSGHETAFTVTSASLVTVERSFTRFSTAIKQVERDPDAAAFGCTRRESGPRTVTTPVGAETVA